MLKEEIESGDVSGYLSPGLTFGFKLPTPGLFSKSPGLSPTDKAGPMPIPIRPGS